MLHRITNRAPRTPEGIAGVCTAAGVLMAAGVFPIAAILYGGTATTQSLIISPIAILGGAALHYLAACGATRHRKPKKQSRK